MSKESVKIPALLVLPIVLITAYIALISAAIWIDPPRQDPSLPLGTRLQNEARSHYEVIYSPSDKTYRVEPLPKKTCKPSNVDSHKVICQITGVESK